MKKQTLQIISVLLVCMLLFAGCGKSDNRYINCDPQYNNSSSKPLSSDAAKISAWTMEDYLAAKEESGFVAWEDWLPWEQFSALGEFHKSFWREGRPGSSQYEYEYTNPTTGKTWIYHVEFDKIPEDSGVTNIKEYYQWYYGKEIVNHPTIMNQPTFAAKDFLNGNLAVVDPDDPVFANCKTKNNDFGYYVDDVLDLPYYDYSDVVSNPRFVYNGWMIPIIKDSVDETQGGTIYAIDDTDAEILRKLMNADTYKEAIEELMNPENAK